MIMIIIVDIIIFINPLWIITLFLRLFATSPITGGGYNPPFGGDYNPPLGWVSLIHPTSHSPA